MDIALTPLKGTPRWQQTDAFQAFSYRQKCFKIALEKLCQSVLLLN